MTKVITKICFFPLIVMPLKTCTPFTNLRGVLIEVRTDFLSRFLSVSRPPVGHSAYYRVP